MEMISELLLEEAPLIEDPLAQEMGFGAAIQTFIERSRAIMADEINKARQGDYD